MRTGGAQIGHRQKKKRVLRGGTIYLELEHSKRSKTIVKSCKIQFIKNNTLDKQYAKFDAEQE